MAKFTADVLEAAEREREVELTTHGRKTGNPHRTVLWLWGDGRRLFVRSGGGPGRDWTRNVLARPEAVLSVGGHDVAVRLRQVEPGEARSLTDLVIRKYGPAVRQPADGAPPTPAERATFELSPLQT
ncbi:MAG TPA: nitroreductase/quinone reductase family protein [Candidatus Dormibacteraeota bacterium]